MQESTQCAIVRYDWAAASLVAFLAAVLYGPTVLNGYVFDDSIIVRTNPVVTEHRLLQAVTTPYWPALEGGIEGSSNWRPLAIASLVLEHRLGGHDARLVHHGTNALLHGLVVLAIFPLVRRLAGRGWPAVAACALFAVHPAHTEVVSPIVGRTDMLAAFGTLVALESFLRYRDSERRAWLVVGAIAWAVGLGGKESAAPLLALLPAADWLVRGRPLRELVGRPALAYVPFLVVAGVYLAARFAVLGGSTFQHAGAVDYTWVERLVFAARNAVVSAVLLVLPLRFHHLVTTLPANAPFTYPDPTGLAAIAWGVGAAGVTLGWLALVRRSPRLAFLWVAAVLTWMPTSGLLPAAAGVALRFLFLPTAFLACAVALAQARLGRTRPALRPVLAAGIAVLLMGGAITSVRQSLNWRNNGTFNEAILAESPGCFAAHMGLGTWIASRRDPDIEAARRHYVEAIRIAGNSPQAIDAKLNLAQTWLLGASGRQYVGAGVRLDDAERLYLDLTREAPDRWEPVLKLADLYDHGGDRDLAVRYYRQFLEKFPLNQRAEAVRRKLKRDGVPD